MDKQLCSFHQPISLNTVTGCTECQFIVACLNKGVHCRCLKLLETLSVSSFVLQPESLTLWFPLDEHFVMVFLAVGHVSICPCKTY